MKEIEIRIDTKGSVRAEALGFTGTTCDLSVSKLATLLGTIEDTKFKPEYYETEQVYV